MTNRYHIRRETLSDGRSLSLYGWAKHDLPRTDRLTAQPPALPQLTPGILTRHPLQHEFVCTSPGRQNRTFKPPADQCPLCPTTLTGPVSEIPFTDFELAVFDNKFPSFVMPDQAVPFADPHLKPAHGKCEVVVYSPDHQQTLGSMTDAQRELLIEAWVHRYDTLLGLPGIAYVHAFENRGEAAGVTLQHPHGQIYAMPFVPPIQRKAADAFRANPHVLADIIHHNPHLIVAERGNLVAFCPDFGTFGYEIWLAPRTPRAGLWSLDKDERQAMAFLLGQITRVYDRVFDQPMPAMMALHCAPPRDEDVWHMHTTFQPFLRSPDKLKYFASIEHTTGVCLKDITAAHAASVLKPLFESDPS